MENNYNDLSIIERIEEITNDRYKYERFVKYIREFDEAWDSSNRKENYNDGKNRLWGTQVKINPIVKISDVLNDPLYTNVNEFFESRDINLIGEISENDLVDLLYHEFIGAKKYLSLLNVLLIEGSDIEPDEHTIVGKEVDENKRNAPPPPLVTSKSEIRNLIMGISNKNNSKETVEDERVVDEESLDEETYFFNEIDNLMPTDEIRNMLNESIDNIVEKYGLAVTYVERLRLENSNLINAIKKKDNIIRTNREKYANQIKDQENTIEKMEEGYILEKEKFEIRANDFETSINSLNKEKSFLEVQLSNYEEQFTNMEFELNRANESLGFRDTLLEDRDKTIENKNRAIEEKDKVIESINRELENTEHIRRTEIEEYKAEIESLKMEIEEQKKTIHEFSSLKGMVDNILKRFKSTEKIND